MHIGYSLGIICLIFNRIIKVSMSSAVIDNNAACCVLRYLLSQKKKNIEREKEIFRPYSRESAPRSEKTSPSKLL